MEQTKMNTGVVRFSYLNATEPRVTDNGAAKYGVCLLVPKTDTETVNKIKQSIKNALANDKEGKNLLKGVSNPKTPFHDGDGEKPNGGEYGPECKGHWVLNTSSINKPGLVDTNGAPMTDKEEWYSGIWGRANINFYAYNSAGNKGIACGLNHLQKKRDGESLGGGGGSATTAFDDGFEDGDIFG